MESWPSGLWRSPRKRVGENPRRFESYTLRQWRSESLGGIIQNPLADFVQRKFEPRPQSTATLSVAARDAQRSQSLLIPKNQVKLR